MKKYIFKRYDPKYKDFFNSEKRKLLKVIGLIKIEHAGSTAVPGLGGKGIIDIAIGTAKSKIATILKRKAIPKISPEIKSFFWPTIKKAEMMMGRSMKFSAFAIFPSKSGSPKRIAKTEVVR